MKRQIEKNLFKDQIEQSKNTIAKGFDNLNKILSMIKEHTSAPDLTNTNDLLSFFKRVIRNNDTNINECLNIAINTIDSFYIDTDILIDTKYFEIIETFKRDLFDFSDALNKQVHEPDENLHFLNSKNKELTEKKIQRMINDFRKINRSFIENIKELNKDLNLIYSQYQLTINEVFKSTLDKEVEKIRKNFQHERLSIFNEYKNDVKNLRIILESEKDNIDRETKKSNSELLSLKTGYTQLKKSNLELTNTINEYSNQINKIISEKSIETSNKLEEHIESQRINFQEKIKEINDSYETAKKNYKSFSVLAERSAGHGLTQNYAKKAKEEKIEYQNYRKYTTFSILAAIGTTVSVILIPIIEHWGATINMDSNYYYTLIARLTISVMFFVLALYLSKQSSKHYECYQENHRTYLQLAALDPFLIRMTDEEQLNIKKSLIPIFFNQNKDGKFASKDDEVKVNIFTSHLKNLKQMSRK